MNTKLEKLFAPLAIGTKNAPNRIVFASHLTNFGFDNVFTGKHAAYYAARAKGGAGLIVTEALVPHSSDYPYPRAIFGYHPAIVESLRMVRSAVKSANSETLLLAQINHSGGQGTEDISLREIVAPSAVQDIITRQVPKAMETDDIKAVIAGFAQTATHIKQAGLDGVELNIADRSLIRQFLSGLTNFRQDEYGGSPENKLRFALEIIEAVRNAIGQDLILGVRLCGDELAPWAGLTPEQAQTVGVALAKTGKLDYISVMMGSIYSLDKAWASMHTPPGFAVHLANGMRKALREAEITIPVFTSGRIGNPKQANDYIAEASADACEMTRALIADPNLPLKAQQDKMGEIRYCTYCNQDCQVRSTMNPLLTCAVNPAAGEEANLSDELIVKTNRPKQVMIIGAGVAGLEAARVATLRGHNVTIYDKASTLGGSVNLAAAGQGRESWRIALDFYKTFLAENKVKVEFNTSVTPEVVEKVRPDVVVVATGGKSVPLHRVTIEPQAKVTWARDIMQAVANHSFEASSFGENIVLIDEVGGFAAVCTAEHLARAGKKVTIVTHDNFISRELPQTLDANGWYGRALSMGMVFTPQKYVRSIEATAVVLEDVYTHAEERLEQVDAVVLANYEHSEDTLYKTLKALPDRTFELHRIGDAVAPRKIGHAVREGNKVARAL
jgi:mycofactocin system FadH/OYE family oxidoreductase 2